MKTLKKAMHAVWELLKRTSYLTRAAGWAMLLGVIETVQNRRGRMVLGVLALLALAVGLVWSKPLRSVEPGEVGIRINRLTGGVSELREGWALLLPGIHRLRRYPLRDQVYRPAHSAQASSLTPFQSIEGLSLGVQVAVRYALDPARIGVAARSLPEELSRELIQPVIDGVLHRTFAKYTVREIFSSKRRVIELGIRDELALLLGKDGVVIRDVFLGNVDLPTEYRRGLEALLSEELSAEKMRYTLELKEKHIKQSALEAEADKVRREKAAEAAGQEQVIAARAQAEAMKHVIPLKEKEIEQKRLEAEASKVRRITVAEGDAQARRIEAQGEADSRRKLAEAEAYHLEVTGKVQHDQLARDGELIARNPLLIQKTLADKLSDKIQVIIAPPTAGGFFANGLLGKPAASENKLATGENKGAEQ